MIELTFTAAFILYLGMTLSVLLGIWVYSHYREKRRPVMMSSETIFICEYCQLAYLENREKLINKCPQCGLYNQKTKTKSKYDSSTNTKN